MIRVPLYLDSANTGRRSELATVEIWNLGDGTMKRGNYGYEICGRRGQRLKTGTILNWPRQSKTAIALLQRVLNDAYPS